MNLPKKLETVILFITYMILFLTHTTTVVFKELLDRKKIKVFNEFLKVYRKHGGANVVMFGEGFIIS